MATETICILGVSTTNINCVREEAVNMRWDGQSGWIFTVPTVRMLVHCSVRSKGLVDGVRLSHTSVEVNKYWPSAHWKGRAGRRFVSGRNVPVTPSPAGTAHSVRSRRGARHAKKVPGTSGGGVGGYTPSRIPVKSEPFCTETEAPAPLSTNTEAYCPACGGGRGSVFRHGQKCSAGTAASGPIRQGPARGRIRVLPAAATPKSTIEVSMEDRDRWNESGVLMLAWTKTHIGPFLEKMVHSCTTATMPVKCPVLWK